MSNQATRFFMAQDQRRAEQSALSSARYALNRFRQNGDASGFPELETYLSSKSRPNFRSLDLTGYCYHNGMGLTEEEFEEFRTVHQAKHGFVGPMPEVID